MKARPPLLVTFLLGALAVGGCAETARQRQLEAVAKDWCLTIRASQVIPIYPLSEDLQPGDVFLIDKPIAQQAREYVGKGFLALDDFVTRLPGPDYAAFYRAAYWDAAFAPLPSGHPRVDTPWMTKSGAGDPAAPKAPAAEGSAPQTPKPDAAAKATAPPAAADVRAPCAAFPTYTVKVRSNTAANLALPIKGIPFAMSLMGAESANVSVSLTGAFTYGSEPTDLLYDLLNWWDIDGPVQQKARAAAKEAAKKKGGWFAPPKRTVFLRVVSRVYLVGQVNVDTSGAGAFGFGADLGKPKSPILQKLNAATFDEDYARILNALSEPLAPAQEKAEGQAAAGAAQTPAVPTPSGSFRFTFATARSVGMQQTFDRPLVVGYLGFDVPVLRSGELGLPMDTRGLIEHPAQAPKPSNQPLLSEPQRYVANDINRLRSAPDPAKQAAWAEQVAGGLARSQVLQGNKPLADRFTGLEQRAKAAQATMPPNAETVSAIVRDLTGALLYCQALSDAHCREIHQLFTKAFQAGP